MEALDIEGKRSSSSSVSGSEYFSCKLRAASISTKSLVTRRIPDKSMTCNCRHRCRILQRLRSDTVVYSQFHASPT